MPFSAQPRFLHEFLGAAGKGFLIPVYQRPFSWGDDQIDRLVEDVAFAARAVVTGAPQLAFVGSFIVVKGSVPAGSHEPTVTYHVVDGQQRLTAVLMLAGELERTLRDLRDELDPDAIIHRSVGTIANRLHHLCALPCDVDRAPPWPRIIRHESDRWNSDSGAARYDSHIANYLSQRIIAEETYSAPSGTPFKTAYEAVVESIDNIQLGCGLLELSDIGGSWESSQSLREFVARDLPPPETDSELRALRTVLFAKSLLQRVQVIEVEAPNEDTAFAIFEPLNTTGQILTALETIKPAAVKAEGGQDNYPGSPTALSLALVEGVVDDEQPEIKAKATSDLMTVFALAESGEKLSHSLGAQRAYLAKLVREADRDRARTVFDSMAAVATFQRDVWLLDDLGGTQALRSGASRVAMRFVKDSNHSITRALFARYYAAVLQDQLAPTEFEKLVKGVAAFWFLWRAARTGTQGIDGHYRTLMSKGWTNEAGQVVCGPIARSTTAALPPVSDLVAALRTILSEKGGFADSEQWIDAAANKNVYGGKSIERFGLLVAHEDAVTSASDDALLADGTPESMKTLSDDHWRRKYTVEHVAPQKPRPGDDAYDSEIYSKWLSHKWGNLTLVPKEENSSLSNRSWPEKKLMYSALGEKNQEVRKALLEEARVELAQSTCDLLEKAGFLVFCQAVAVHDEPIWTSDRVQRRSAGLARRMANLLWPWIA